MRYLEVCTVFCERFFIDRKNLQSAETLFSQDSVYFRFLKELIVNLKTTILPEKRQQKFFKNFESFFEEHSRMISKISLQNIFAKFYRTCFGEETYSQILDNPSWATLDERQNLRITIHKEDLVNFDEKSYDFLLDVDDYNARQGIAPPKKFYFNRMNFSLYFLQFFTIKSGFKRIAQFLNGFVSRMVHDLRQTADSSDPKTTIPESKSSTEKNHVPSDIFYKLFDISFLALNKLKSSQKHHKTISLDQNFIPPDAVENQIFSNTQKDKNVLQDEKNTFHEEEQTRVFSCCEVEFMNFYISSLSDLAEAGLNFFKNWKPIHAYGNQIFTVISLVNYVEKVVGHLRIQKNGASIVEDLERRVVSKKISEEYFLEIYIMVIKTYLKNPNYAQKMNVGNLLNTLEDYVGIFYKKWVEMAKIISIIGWSYKIRIF